jgi:tRNA-2-methylthio-N6-dimethylallyladenosine synthase
MVTVQVTQAKPYFLLADTSADLPYSVRRTAAGDAWDRAQAASCGLPAPQALSSGKVSLSLSVRKPND